MASGINIFGDNLKLLRRSKNLTQEGLAELSEMAQTTIAAYETGRAWPSKEAAYGIAKALKVPMSRMFFNPNDIDAELALQVIQVALKKK